MPDENGFITLDRRVRNIILYDFVLYGEGHLIRRWFRDVNADFKRNARAQAPMNKRPKDPEKPERGHLKRSIRVRQDRVGPRQLRSRLYIGADYATYVIRGTRGKNPIFARKPKGMRIYYKQLKGVRKPKTGEHVWRYAVRGQRRNAFLDRAATITARQHPSVKGLTRKKLGMRTRIGML